MLGASWPRGGGGGWKRTCFTVVFLSMMSRLPSDRKRENRWSLDALANEVSNRCRLTCCSSHTRGGNAAIQDQHAFFFAQVPAGIIKHTRLSFFLSPHRLLTIFCSSWYPIITSPANMANWFVFELRRMSSPQCYVRSPSPYLRTPRKKTEALKIII